jgi:hypothetical protein
LIYSPKRDSWVAVLILTIGAIQLSGACLLLVSAIRMHQPGILVPAAVLMAVAFFLVWIWSSSSYEITETDLVIRFGPLHWTVPLETIEEVYSTGRLKADVGWGLAWSIDRMRIKCRGRLLPFWISPDDKAGFIAELFRAHPGLKVIEDR